MGRNFPFFSKNEFQYVNFDKFDELQNILGTENQILILGPPGVGKSTCLENFSNISENTSTYIASKDDLLNLQDNNSESLIILDDFYSIYLECNASDKTDLESILASNNRIIISTTPYRWEWLLENWDGQKEQITQFNEKCIAVPYGYTKNETKQILNKRFFNEAELNPNIPRSKLLNYLKFNYKFSNNFLKVNEDVPKEFKAYVPYILASFTSLNSSNILDDDVQKDVLKDILAKMSEKPVQYFTEFVSQNKSISEIALGVLGVSMGNMPYVALSLGMGLYNRRKNKHENELEFLGSLLNLTPLEMEKLEKEMDIQPLTFQTMQKISKPETLTQFENAAEAFKGEIEGKITDLENDFETFKNEVSILIQQSNTLSCPMPRQARTVCEHFVDRSDISGDIKDRLLTDDASQNALAITTIQGLPGVGKTELASDIANDKDVKKRFSDGTLWVTLGQEPENLLSSLIDWVQALGDHNFKPTTIEAASNHLQSLLDEKAVLLVIDDVWDTKNLKHFLVGGSRCHVLFTTRRADVADEMKAQLYNVPVMTAEQSLDLLSNKLGYFIEDSEREEALRVAKSVGNLPLALELVAVRIGRGTTWIKLYNALREEIAKLEVLEDPKSRLKGELRLEACFNLSLKELKSSYEEVWESFVWLGVLPEDTEITALMATTLWNLDEEEYSEVLLETLWSEALLIRDSQIQFGEQVFWVYRVHDVLHDIARRLLTGPITPKKKGNLPGLGIPLSDAHAHLLELYSKKLEDGKWSSLQDDRYIHFNLIWHMQKAGWIEEIHALLREETATGRNAWYEAREFLGQTAGFIEDVNLAWQLAEDESESKIKNSEIVTTISLEFRYVLMIATVNSLSVNIPPNLLTALVEHGLWSTNQGLAYARQTPNTEQRVEALTKVATNLSESQKGEVMKEAMEEAMNIQDEKYRAKVLSSLTPHLPESLMKEALEVATNIHNEYCKAEVLSSLAPHLSESLMKEALEVAMNIQYKNYRVKVLSSLAPHLPESLMKEALEVAMNTEYEYSKARALSSLAPHLSESLMKEALEVAMNIEYKEDRAIVLSSLAPHLPESQKEEVMGWALEAIMEISDLRDRVKKNELVRLAHHLPESMIEKMLDVAMNIEYEEYRATVLSSLAPHLLESQREKIMKEALEAVTNIQDEEYRATVLSILAPHLPESQKEEIMKELLETATKFRDEKLKTGILVTLAPHLPESMMKRALTAATSIQDEEYRATVLSSLAPHLPKSMMEGVLEEVMKIQDRSVLVNLAPHLPESQREEIMKEALEAVTNIQDEGWKIDALSVLTPHLPRSMIKGAFEVATNIQDEKLKKDILVDLAPHLPESMMKGVVEAATNIQDEFWKASVLSSLASHLPESMMKEALEAATNIQDEKLKKDVLVDLALHLPESLMKEAFKEVMNIQDEGLKVRALSSFVSHLSESMMKEALEVATNIHNEYCKAKVLSSLAPHLPESMMEGALETATNIQDEKIKTDVLVDLAPYLPESKRKGVIKDVLIEVTNIQDEFRKARALISLTPHLPESMIEGALDEVSNIQDEFWKARTLFKLASQLPESMMKKVLEAATNIQDEKLKADALIVLVPYLPKSLMKEALEVATKIKDEYSKARALSSLAPHLPKSIMKKVLEAATNIQDEFHKANVLIDLAPHLPESLMKEALEVATKHEYSKATTLIGLAPHLPESLMKEALEVAMNIEHKKYRVKVLSSFAPHLPESQREEIMKEALEAVTNIQDDESKARVLIALAPSLPESMMKEAFEVVTNITERWKARALVGLSPHLPESMMEEALEVAMDIQDEGLKARVLTSLAPYLPESMMKEALEVAMDIQDKYWKADTLAEILFPHMSNYSLDSLYPVWMEILHGFAIHTRRELYINLKTLSLLIYKLGEDEAMSETFDAIQDVNRWWP